MLRIRQSAPQRRARYRDGRGKNRAKHLPFTSLWGTARFVRSTQPMANRMLRLGCATGRALQNCLHSVRFQNKGFTKYGGCWGGHAEVGETLYYLVAATGSPHLAAATERGPPGVAATGSAGRLAPPLSASLHDLPMATLGTANTPYQRLPCQCPKMIPYPRRRQSQH